MLRTPIESIIYIKGAHFDAGSVLITHIFTTAKVDSEETTSCPQILSIVNSVKMDRRVSVVRQ